jgi:hypothetical protein
LQDQMAGVALARRRRLMTLPRHRVERAYLDLDGTLVNFIGAAMKMHGFDANNFYGKAENKGVFRVAKKMGLTEEQFWGPLNNHHFWDSLEWLPDGRKILALVEAAFGPENVEICTSPPAHAQSIAGKYTWIERHLPNYARDGRLMIVRGKFKAAGPGRLLIDDSDEQLSAWQVAGGATLVVPRAWNSHHWAGDTVKYMAFDLDKRFQVQWQFPPV